MSFQRFVSVASLALAVAGTAACSSPPAEDSMASGPMLTGDVWQLQQIQYNDGKQLEANPPERYTVEFMDDGQVAIQADCNQGHGSFTTTDSSQISISEIAITRAACPTGSISNEFVQGLSNAAIYFFQDGDLFIDIKYGTGTMHFSTAGS